MDKYISRHIDRLLLDPNNYRFIDNKDYRPISIEEVPNERIQLRTRNFLVGRNEEGIADLITSFKSNGVLKLDPIQVKEIPDSKDFLVVEGNRRTAALKFLYEQWKIGNDVGKLTQESFKSVDVVLISDESPIQHLITMGLHHISGKRKWSPVNQAQLIYDLRFKHDMSEMEICDSLSITKHSLRRNLRVLALIDRYKESDYGDQFQANKYSIFEEVVKKVEMKSWLEWNDDTYQAENKVNEEKLFSWISKEEVIERDEESGEENKITKDPIITKSHEIRDLSKFINDSAAVEQMEERRSITAGFALSDAVGVQRLQKAMDNIGKEVQAAFQFSEYLEDEDYSKVAILRDKLDRLIPSSNGVSGLVQKSSNRYFSDISSHFHSVKVGSYRKLKNLDISQFSRVNIIAGGNNTGKTSLLEALYLLTRLNNIPTLIELERFRGRFYDEFHTKWFDKLFISSIGLSAVFNDTEIGLSVNKQETEEQIDKSQYLNSIISEAIINGEELDGTIHLFNNREPELYYQKSKVLCEATFTSPYRFNDDLLIKAHARAVENRYLDEVVAFINSKMDESIEKIEMISIENESRLMVSSSKLEYAIDLTKYGEGLQRVVEIALLMGYSQNGIICIDELDSAIHKSLLRDFTSFIQEAAAKFNVQVFLTTHSKECIDAFVENSYPDDELTAFALSENNDGKIISNYLPGNKLKQLVDSINLDIR
ncbi:AAA family ATPase [Lewinella cohaerens]|uniref:AAA family ATPase n=1 Tax=Lewinella cohaerens TaxID=70995 RepID=UPI00037CF766|nr:AAA family ATPase [Lewinella cohaerens]